MPNDATARGADRPPGRDDGAARAAAADSGLDPPSEAQGSPPQPPWWAPSGAPSDPVPRRWRPGQLLGWLRPTPAELVGLALLVLGSVAATLVWWGQSVTAPAGVEQLRGGDTELTGQAPATAPPGGAPAETSDGSTVAPGRADDLSTTPGPSTVAVTVHVSGAVSRPGLVTLPGGGRVGDAVVAAGGLTAEADPGRVNLARTLMDGEHVHLPRIGEDPPAPVAPTGDAPAAGPGTTGQAAAAPLDLNRATAAELEELPGIGPTRAAAIVEHRERNGPFTVPGDLRGVPGIGEATFQNLAPLVVVR